MPQGSIEGGAESTEIPLVDTTHEFCDYLTSRWVVEEGYITEDQKQNVASVILMTSSDIDGADLRLVVDPSPLKDTLKLPEYGVKVRFGSSDKVIGKSTVSVGPEIILKSGKGKRSLLEDHIIAISEALSGERPVAVQVLLSYPSPSVEDMSLA